jgi:hypothetical protein
MGDCILRPQITTVIDTYVIRQFVKASPAGFIQFAYLFSVIVNWCHHCFVSDTEFAPG